MNEVEPMAYLATKECGCLTLAICDEPHLKKEIAKEVARALRAGDKVARVTCEYVRSYPWKCETHKQKRVSP
jgi:hypothetical protein